MTDPLTAYQIGSLALAGGSMVMSWLGGRKADKNAAKVAEAQHEYDKKVYDFNWQETQDQYEFIKEGTDMAAWNLEQTRQYKNRLAANTWVDKEKLRLFDYNTAIKAYNASVASSKEQLSFNNKSYEMSMNAHQREYQDELDLLGFKYEDVQLGWDETKGKITLGKKGLTTQATAIKSRAKLDRQGINRSLKSKQKEFNNKLQLSKIEGLQKKGQIRNLGQTGRSARKGLAAITAQEALASEMIVDAMFDVEGGAELDLAKLTDTINSQGSELNLKDSQLSDDLLNATKRKTFDESQLKQTLKSANLQKDWDMNQMKLEKYQQDLNAHNMIKAKPVPAPQLAKPLDVPTPKLQKPKKPRPGPEPIKYAGSSGSHSWAGLASGLQTFSSALAGVSK